MAAWDTFVICSHCGSKNRIPAHGEGQPRCGKCKTTFAAEVVAKAREAGAPVVPTGQAPRRYLLSFLLASLIILNVAGATWLVAQILKRVLPPPQQAFLPQSGSPSAPIPSVQRPKLKAQLVATGVLYNQTGRAPLAPLRVRTTAGGDYYLKLVGSTHSTEAVGIYVHGGTTLEVEVPLGSYRMRYAYGSTWYGTKWAFGDDTQYFEADKVFDFEATSDGVSGYTVELIPQPNGNLATASISAEDF
jgi:hypothetical protein